MERRNIKRMMRTKAARRFKPESLLSYGDMLEAERTVKDLEDLIKYLLDDIGLRIEEVKVYNPDVRIKCVYQLSMRRGAVFSGYTSITQIFNHTLPDLSQGVESLEVFVEQVRWEVDRFLETANEMGKTYTDFSS